MRVFDTWSPQRGQTRAVAVRREANWPEEAARAWAEATDSQQQFEQACGQDPKHDPIEHDCDDEGEPGCVVYVAEVFGGERNSGPRPASDIEPRRYRVTAETRIVYDVRAEP